VLGEGTEIVVVDVDAWRTKAAKEARDEAREAGKVPVLAAKYDEAAAVAETIREQIAGFGYDLSGGLTEQAMTWNEYVGTEPVLCRARMDKLWIDEGRIIDFKTIRSANPDTCARHAIDYGYAIQDAAYCSAVEALRPELIGRVEMTFLFCETEPPFAVTPAVCAGSMREIGKGRWRRAVEVWERCLRTGHWPGYTTTTVRLEAPPWVLAKEMMEDAA